MVVVIRLPGSARDWYEFGSRALDHQREQRGIQQYESATVNIWWMVGDWPRVAINQRTTRWTRETGRPKAWADSSPSSRAEKLQQQVLDDWRAGDRQRCDRPL